MAVVYEWIVEEYDEYGDITVLQFFPTRAEAEAYKPNEDCASHAIGLVRDVFKDDDLDDRQWAYLDENGQLPTEFSEGALMPARFLRKVK